MDHLYVVNMAQKQTFENMTNYAIPLVILTWHRMIQEYFWKNEKKSFFQYGSGKMKKSRSFNMEIICLENKGFLKMPLAYI
jgi:hypothetical protein